MSKFKILVVFVFFILIVAFLYGCSTKTEETEEIEYNGFILKKEENSYTVVKCVSTKEKVVIPSEYNKLPVSRIGERAFRHCDSLTSIGIPNSVTSIGTDAFYSCDSLKSVTFGGNSKLTSIENSAFLRCSSLTSIGIPDSVTYIESRAFLGCNSLTSISIPDSVTYIGDDAFTFCDSLTNVTIGDSVTHIGDNAFAACFGLTNVTIGDSLRSIGYTAFLGCYSLTSILINAIDPPSLDDSYLTDNLFDDSLLDDYSIFNSLVNYKIYVPAESVDCYKSKFREGADHIEAIGNPNQYIVEDGFVWSADRTMLIMADKNIVGEYSIPDSVTSIGDLAFINCDSVTSIKIPDSVTSIGNNAFTSCDNLTSITIPDSATSIGEDAFYNTAWYNSLPNGLVYAGKVVLEYKGEMLSDTSIVLLDGTKGIASRAFYDCNSLTSITIPDSVTSIGNHAFNSCDSLTSVTFGENSELTSIGGYAFNECDSLTSITIPNSVTSIGNHAFYECQSLISITSEAEKPPSLCDSSVLDYLPLSYKIYVLAESVNAYKTAGNWLEYDNHIESIGNPNQYIVEDGFVYSADRTDIIMANKNIVGEYSIPDSVTSIGNRLFYNCSNLTSIIIPDSVTSIGSSAFSGCNSLTSITIPDSVTRIGWRAFCGCSGLESISVNINNTIYESIDNCVIEIATNTLILGCKSSIIPDSVTSIGDYAFHGCSSLSSIIIPDSVTSIGDDAFYWCDDLTTITFGENSELTSIGNWAFSGCDGLTSITIPDRVTSIGWDAFTGSNLTIYAEAISELDGWDGNWNRYNRPIIWNCTLSQDKTYVVSIDKRNIVNTKSYGLSNPFREGYTFGGWYVSDDFSGTKYDTIERAPSGTLYAKWVEVV